ncbi:MAG: beta strand repeat-containing protein, partial [Phycisphaerales bacterium]
TVASLISSGFVDAGNGVYTFSGTAEEATNAIRALAFDPTNNRVNPGQTETSTFTVTVSDGTTPVSDAGTSVVSTSVNDAPFVGGAAAAQAVNDNATRAPFSNFTITDFDAGQTLTVSVALDTAAKGAFTSDSLTASGFTLSAPGVYTFSGNAADATAAIRALVFNPADNRVAIGSTETTTFTVTVSDGLAAAASNSTTTVVSTSTNDAPVVGAVTTTPTSVLRNQAITLTASGITDADNTATQVEFYRDANGNGTFEPEIDTLLGTATISGGVATRSFNTTTFGAGTNTFFARAKDTLNLWGSASTGTGTVTNRTPTVSSLSRSIDPVVNVGDMLTLTASSVADADGTIARVQFYRDADGNGQFDANIDTLLGEDTSASGGYKLTFATTGFSTGTNRYYARVTDNDGGQSSVVTITNRVNAAPTFTTFSAGAAAVSRGASVVLTASGATDTDGTVSRIEFYRDANGNGTFDAGTDILVGTDSSASGGNYTFNAPTAALTAGDNVFFSRTKDNNGAFSAARSVTVTVNNVAPTLGSLTRSPAVVTVLGNMLTLTANSVTDADGTVASVQFYRDADGDGQFDANIDTLIGTDTSATSGYTLAIATNFFTVGV